jgi:hypothetical protein
MLALERFVVTTERDDDGGVAAQGIQPRRGWACIAVACGHDSLLPQHGGLVTFDCLAGAVNSNAFHRSNGTTEKAHGLLSVGLEVFQDVITVQLALSRLKHRRAG